MKLPLFRPSWFLHHQINWSFQPTAPIIITHSHSRPQMIPPFQSSLLLSTLQIFKIRFQIVAPCIAAASTIALPENKGVVNGNEIKLDGSPSARLTTSVAITGVLECCNKEQEFGGEFLSFSQASVSLTDALPSPSLLVREPPPPEHCITLTLLTTIGVADLLSDKCKQTAACCSAGSTSQASSRIRVSLSKVFTSFVLTLGSDQPCQTRPPLLCSQQP